MSVLLGGLGRAEEALAACEEATGIYRELTAGRPGAFRPDLATSLDTLSEALATWAGRRTPWQRWKKPSPSASS